MYIWPMRGEIEESERQVKTLAIFFQCPKKQFLPNTIPNSDVGIFSPKTEGKKTKAAGVFYMRMVLRKIRPSPIL
jgi:hypothetical protein